MVVLEPQVKEITAVMAMELIHQLVIMQPLVAVVLVHLGAITQQAPWVVEDLVAMVLHHPY